MARGSDVDENGNPIDPSQPAPTPGNGFYSLAYRLPDGTTVYQDGQGHYFTNDDMGPNGQTPRGHWNPYNGAVPNTPPASTPPGAPGNPQGTVPQGPKPDTTTKPPPGKGGGGGLIDPFPEIFKPPAWADIPGAPNFTPPTYTPPPAFAAPSYADVQNEPGYAFARDQGMQAIEHSKAAGGIYNSPATLKELARFNTGLADQTYGNVFNRAATTYGTNYQTQYVDPYKNAYQSALDVFNPQFSAWQTNAAATQRKNEFGYNTAFDQYKFDYQRWLDRINESKDIATA